MRWRWPPCWRTSKKGRGDSALLHLCFHGDAFALRGAKLVFVDIRPDTMNIDEKLIEAAITDRTRAIAVVHYAGVACEMDTIMEIARRHHLLVVEDAAQGVNAFYKGRALGTIGDFGCYSFHETKNYSMGRAAPCLSTVSRTWNVRRSSVKRAPTAASFSVGKLINTRGWTLAPPTCQAT